jgi:integrase
MEPESVKRLLANCSWSEGGKQRIAEEVDRFYRYEGLKWEKPRYEKIDLLPYIPKEEEVNALVTGLYNRIAGTFCLLLKETGCRPGEAWITEWVHIDLARNSIIIRPEKGSRSRELRISDSLIARLNLLPKNRKYVFHDGSVDPILGLKRFTRMFQRERKALSLRLNNPRLQLISFRTLRHFKGTMEYHKTKDILHVMRILGHRNIQNTLVYTHLVNFESDDYVCKVAKTVDEAKALIETGFDYVTDMGDTTLFRKRK